MPIPSFQLYSELKTWSNKIFILLFLKQLMLGAKEIDEEFGVRALHTDGPELNPTFHPLSISLSRDTGVAPQQCRKWPRNKNKTKPRKIT